jgi:hypothetical protein
VYVRPTAPRSIGEILDDGFKLYRESFAKSWPLALGAQLILDVPSVILQYQTRGLVVGGSPQAMLAVFSSPSVWLSYVVCVVVFLGFYNGLIVQLDAAATAKMIARGRALAAGFRLLPRMLVLSIVMLVVFSVAALLAAFFGSVLRALHAPILIFVLVVALAAILIYVWGRVFLANIALVVEDAQVFKALDISWTLIKDHWWRTATVYTIALILVMAFYVIIAVINAALAVTTLRNPFGIGSLISHGIAIVGGAVLMPFPLAVLLAMYHDLKLRKEGVDLASRVNALAPR